MTLELILRMAEVLQKDEKEIEVNTKNFRLFARLYTVPIMIRKQEAIRTEIRFVPHSHFMPVLFLTN